jgi:hypothetical protein
LDTETTVTTEELRGLLTAEAAEIAEQPGKKDFKV